MKKGIFIIVTSLYFGSCAAAGIFLGDCYGKALDKFCIKHDEK